MILCLALSFFGGILGGLSYMVWDMRKRRRKTRTSGYESSVFYVDPEADKFKGGGA